MDSSGSELGPVLQCCTLISTVTNLPIFKKLGITLPNQRVLASEEGIRSLEFVTEFCLQPSA